MRSTVEFTRPIEYISPMDDFIGKIMRDWAEKHIMPHRRKYDEDWEGHELIEPAMDVLLGEMGLQRVLFPREYGGWGLGQSSYLGTTAFKIHEEIARADSGVGVAFGVVFWPMMMICREPHINHRLCAEFAPLFCNSNKAVFAANAMTEPQGGADIENLDLLKGSTIRTTAVLDGDEWVINGHKLWPSNSGGAAKLLGVVCTTNPGSTDLNDFTFIYVPGDLPGVTQGRPYQKAGMAADKNSDIWFENVRVPAYYRALGPGDDYKYFKEVISFGNMGSVALVCGSMMNVYEILKEFCETHYFRGKPLKENDAVAGVLADIVRDIDIIRVVGYQYARMLDRPNFYGERWDDEIMAKGRVYKWFAADQAVKDLGKAMNLMEGYGSDRAWDIEKHWRDIKMAQLWLGGKQLCQMEAARYYFDCETL